MKKHILKIVVFLMPLFVLAIGTEVAIRLIPNDFKKKKEFLDFYEKDIEVLILGGSHSTYGLNPVFLSKNCFNASQVSQSLDLDLELIKKYEKEFEKLEIIVLPISYPTFFTKLITSQENWRIKNYCIYYRMPVTNKYSYYSELLSNELSVNMERLYKYYVLRENNMLTNKLGWDSTYHEASTNRNLISTGIIAAERHTVEDTLNYRSQVAALEEIIMIGMRNDIKILLFMPPAYSTYVENLDHDQLILSLSTAKTISDNHFNCFYYNLLIDTDFKQYDYYDADHLDRNGAKKLSLKIDSIISVIQER